MSQQSSEFKKLQKIWYAKLKDSGFEDAEQSDGNLKKWSSLFLIHSKGPLLRDAKQTYYRWAEHFLNDHKFDSTTEKLIWFYHSEGMSVRDIAAKLKELGLSTISFDTVSRRVIKLRKVMIALHKGKTNE